MSKLTRLMEPSEREIVERIMRELTDEFTALLAIRESRFSSPGIKSKMRKTGYGPDGAGPARGYDLWYERT